MKIYNLAFLLLFLFSFNADHVLEFPQASPLPDSKQKQKTDEVAATNMVFKSTDGGQTWKDISEGLFDIWQGNVLQRDGFFANDNGLYLRAGDGIYHSMPNSTAPFWKKEIFPDKHSSIAPGKAGIFAYNYEGRFLQKLKGTNVWSPFVVILLAFLNHQTKEKHGNCFFLL
ncbi:beta propeller repeat protein [Flavitalea sp.]|nr:hypothetical protein [Flavitalea sp.]